MTTTIEQGGVGEDLACNYLEDQGLSLIKRNFRCRVGELDLIMRDGDTLVFVEVRSRHDSRYGTPAETITRKKQRRVIRAASYYLQKSRFDAPCRFDVVAISYPQGQRRLEWIKDAFRVD